MKRPFYKRKLFLIPSVIVGALAVAQPALAIFGFGDIVFDPTSYATLGNIFTSDASILTKAAGTLQQTVKIYNNAVQTYNLAMTMAQHFTQKGYWKSVGVQMKNTSTYNIYGETAGWNQNVNGGIGNSTSTWNSATISLNNNPWIRTEPLGQSSQLATYASAEISDGASRLALDTLDAVSMAQSTNQSALQALETNALDGSDGGNTEVKQLNIIGGASMQELHDFDTLISIQKANLQLAIAANKIQRDAAAHAANFFTTYDNSLVNEAADWGSAAESFSNYRMP
ncbi:MAG: hypothetical protein WA324_00940 [Bryobacteraceae bacterium]